MKTFKLTSIIIAAAVIAGCSSVPKKEDIKQTTKAGTSLQVPEWYLSEANITDSVIKVTSTDISNDMQYAIDKATFNAQVLLAKHLNSDVESLQRSSVRETDSNGTKIARIHTDSISKITTKQTLSFFTRTKLEVIKEDTNYRAFVMLQLPVSYAEQLTNIKFSSSTQEEFKRLDDETKSKN